MNRTAVEEIKARIPIEELIGSYLKLDKAGRSYKARCPFHNEKTPSFFISPERGGYYCFGCGSKGDIFTFVEQFEGLDFRGALKVLAERAGVRLDIDKRADSDRDRLFEITEQAAKYFEDQYERSSEAKGYIASRGISPESRAAFRIGWAPLEWKNLLTFLKSKGWTEGFIEKAGLIKEKTTDAPADANSVSTAPKAHEDTLQASRGRGNRNYYDRFRGRIIFPITDSSGRVVAFTGRILKDDGKSAKYLNSPDTPLFNKSQILFGLDKAKTEIRRVGYSILVEGQMDLVLSHQVGVKNTIAASGTALTDQATGQEGIVSNLGMVRRLSPNMIIALDSDKAGRAAAMRAVAATALSMGMSVKIADIEGGKDPADLIKSDPDSWKDVLRNAKHVIEFELKNVMDETTDSRKLGAAIRTRVFPFLAKIESEMDKAYYVKHIAETTGLTELSVWEDLKKVEHGARNTEYGIRNTPARHASQSEAGRQNGGIIASDPDSRIASPVLRTSSSSLHRLDLVERRMLGLLALMEQAHLPDASVYRGEIEKIAGATFEDRLQRFKAVAQDAAFEAEALFGETKDRWSDHMDELIINFEEDILNEELSTSLGELKRAEKEGKQDHVAELAKKCQVLSLRKSQLSKKRQN